ncbi:MAG: c-type cytochrome biogenesis protein CcmI, partial [Rhodobacteraceae bacterium]|nr:c-type cytochrome biogenesis protein CcmI [Paracoccaceae bacterium]
MWTVLLIMPACLCALIILVLIYRSKSPVSRDLDMDLGAYKAQLRDIRQDIANKTMSEDEGAVFVRDVHRRILAASRRHDRSPQQDPVPRSLCLAAAVLAVLLLLPGSLGVLLISGYQHVPDMPIAERLEQTRLIRDERPDQLEYIAHLNRREGMAQQGLTEELNQALESAGNDAEALVELAREQVGLENYHAATVFQHQAIKILKDDAGPRLHTEMAAYLVAEAGGYVSP